MAEISQDTSPETPQDPLEAVAPKLAPESLPALRPTKFTLDLILSTRQPSNLPVSERNVASIPYSLSLAHASELVIPNLIRGLLGDFFPEGSCKEDAWDFDTSKFVKSTVEDFGLQNQTWFLFTPQNEKTWLCIATSSEMCETLQRYGTSFRGDRECMSLVFLVQLYKPSVVPGRLAVPVEGALRDLVRRVATAAGRDVGLQTEFVTGRSLALLKTGRFENGEDGGEA